MDAFTWEAYLLADTGIMALIAIYALVMLIISLVQNSPAPYKSRIVFRSLAFSLAAFQSFIFLILFFNENVIGNDILQVCIILLSNGTCLSFYFSVLEWNAVSRNVVFIPCQKNAIFILNISIIGVTGLCQFCSYFIQTKSSQFVFFFINNFALFIQMEFVLGYGSLYSTITIHDLNEDSPNDDFRKYQKIPFIGIIIFIFMALFGFGCFLASFCVALDHTFNYN